MLPGFPFLLAAIFFSGSMMVFGLGAAAVLRTAHEEFAYNPSWRAPPEPKFTQSEGAARPNLAMLRVEPRPLQVSEQKTADVTANTSPADPPVPAELIVGAAPEPQIEKTAATGAQYAWPPFQVDQMTTAVAADRSPTDDAVEQLVANKPEIGAEPVALSENAAAPAAPGTADTEITSPERAKPGLAEAAKPEAANPEQMGLPSTPEPTGSVTTVANLGEQSAMVEEPAKASAKPDENGAKARLQAQRARARRLARARLARQQAAAQAQFLFFPFFVPQQQPPPTQQQRRVIQARNP